MWKQKSLWAVVGVAAIFVVGFLAFGILEDSKKQLSFSADGYVLAKRSETEQGSELVHYYTSGSSYKNQLNGEVSFKDNENKQVSVPEASFLHYTDGSIASLGRGVVLDMSSLSSGETMNYYQVQEKEKIESVSDSVYRISSDEESKLQNFVYKIDNNKYMVVSRNITWQSGNGEPMRFEDYVEVESQGGLVRLSNDKGTWRTIDANSYLQLENGTVVRLVDQTISSSLESEPRLRLQELVIHQDDEIVMDEKDGQVIPKYEITTIDGKDGEKGEEGEVGVEGEAGANGSTGGSAGDGGTVGGGGDGDGGSDGEGNERVVLPYFYARNDKIGPSSAEFTLSFEDEQNLLVGNITVKVFDIALGKVVFDTEDGGAPWNSGTFEYKLSLEDLKPAHQYRLTITADYEIDGTKFTREFLNKFFYADAAGVEIEKVSASQTSLIFNVNRKNYSSVNSATLTLYDENMQTIIDTHPLMGIAQDSVKDVVFDRDLKPDTKYYAVIENVTYSDSASSPRDEIVALLEVHTLKENPVIGKPAVILNRKNNSFEFAPKIEKDPNNGITRFRYDIYTAVNGVATELVKTVYSTDKNASAAAFIDNIYLQREVTYIVRAVAEFYDNEKKVEFVAPDSDIFVMRGAKWPTVYFEPDKSDDGSTFDSVTFNQIKGNLYIDCADALLKGPIQIVYTNGLGETTTYATLSKDQLHSHPETTNSYYYPIEAKGLRMNDIYTFSVYGTIDVNDGNGDQMGQLLGRFVVNTLKTQTLNVESVTYSDLKHAFKLGVKFTNPDGWDHDDVPYEVRDLANVTLRLFAGTSSNDRQLGSDFYYEDRNPNGALDHNSELKEKFYDDYFVITENTFGLTASEIDENIDRLTVQISGTVDGTKYENKIPITTSEFIVKRNQAVPELPTDLDKAMSFIEIRNSDVSSYFPDMQKNPGYNDDTIVGIGTMADFDNKAGMAREFRYYLKDNQTGKILVEITGLKPIEPSGVAPLIHLPFGKKEDEVEVYLRAQLKNDAIEVKFHPDIEILSRGVEYRFTYRAGLKVDPVNPEAIDYWYPDGHFEEGETIPDLSSPTTLVKKQLPAYQMAPWESDRNSSTWKYYVYDPDKTGVANDSSDGGRIFLYQDGKSDPIGTMHRNVDPEKYDASIKDYLGGSGDDLKATDLSDQLTLYVYHNETIYDDETYEKRYNLVNELFDQGLTFTKANLTLHVEQNPSANRMKLTVENKGDTSNNHRFAGMFVKISNKNTGQVELERLIAFDEVTQDGAIAYISYSDLENAVKTELEIEATVYYDGGVSGIKAVKDKRNVAILGDIRNDFGTVTSGSYYFMDEAGKLKSSPRAAGSIFQSTVGDYNNLTGVIYNKKLASRFDFNTSGMFDPSGAVNGNATFKRLEEVVIDDIDGKLEIDVITPTIVLRSEDINEKVTLDSATVPFFINGSSYIDGVGKKEVYFELYKQEGTAFIKVERNDLRVEIEKDGVRKELVINDLDPATNYYLLAFANVNGKKTSLFDHYMQTPDVRYPFNTLSEIEIDITNHEYEASDYLTKSLNFHFTLKPVLTGYKLNYYLYTLDDAGQPIEGSAIDLVDQRYITSPQTILTEEMDVAVWMFPLANEESQTPKSCIKFDTPYRLQIVATRGEGETMQQLGLEEYDFRLSKPNRAMFNLGSTAKVETDPDTGEVTDRWIEFTAAVADLDRTIVPDIENKGVYGHYAVRFFVKENGNLVDVTPEEYVGEEGNWAYFTSEKMQQFYLRDENLPGDLTLQSDTDYIMHCYAVLDVDNDGFMDVTPDVAVQPIDKVDKALFEKNVSLDSVTGQIPSGVSLGNVTVGPVRDVPNKARIIYDKPFGLERISRVEYSVFDSSMNLVGQKSSSFEALALGNDRYEFTLDVLFNKADLYTIQISYFDAGDNFLTNSTLNYLSSYNAETGRSLFSDWFGWLSGK